MNIFDRMADDRLPKRPAGRRGGRREEDKRQRVEKTISQGCEEVAGSTPPLTKGKEEERDSCNTRHYHCVNSDSTIVTASNR